uniref:(northern house mosquito) hypothetical protein n=1 Tax=Culex pipiens TaxID=7175 RepID=A0A8D8GUN9_CULPI
MGKRVSVLPGEVRNPICINQFINLALIVFQTNNRWIVVTHTDTHTDSVTVTNSGTQFIWPKFPSGLIFPCCVVQVQLLVVDERRLLSLWFLRPGVSAVVTVTVAPADIAKSL